MLGSNFPVDEWERTQMELAEQAIVADPGGWQAGNPPVEFVGGLDMTSSPKQAVSDQEAVIASFVIVQLPELHVVYQDTLRTEFTVSYVPSLLGFRQVPVYKELIRRAFVQGAHADVILVDGFGRLHPRRCGSATHLGVEVGMSTIGVARNILACQDLTVASVRQDVQAEVAKRSDPSRPVVVPLTYRETSELLGTAVCPPGVTRPIFVSPGHLIGVETSVKIVLACCKHQIPEPLRLADINSRALARNHTTS